MFNSESFGGVTSEDTDKKKKQSKPAFVAGSTPWLAKVSHVKLDIPHEAEIKLRPTPLIAPKGLLESMVNKDKNRDEEGSKPHVALSENQPIHLRRPAETERYGEAIEMDEDSEEDDDDDGKVKTQSAKSIPKIVTEAESANDATSLEELMSQIQTDLKAEDSEAEVNELMDSEYDAHNVEQDRDVLSEELPVVNTSGPQPLIATNTASRSNSPAQFQPPAGGGLPPRPPAPPVPPAAGNFGPNNWNPGQWNANMQPSAPDFASQPAAAPNFAPNNNSANRLAIPLPERRNKPSELFVAALTGWMLKGYFANKKFKQQAKSFDKQQTEQSERLNRLQDAHNQLTAAYNTQTQEMATSQKHVNAGANSAPNKYNQPLQHVPENQLNYAPPLQQNQYPRPFAPEQRFVQPLGPEMQNVSPLPQNPEAAASRPDENIVLQPGQHLERAGSYSIVKDDHNQIVQGAINYGEAFKGDQRKEQIPLAKSPNSSDPTQGTPFFSTPSVPGLGSGQVDMHHELPVGHPLRTDSQHMIDPYSENDSSGMLKSAVSNPWLWAAVLVWMAVFLVVVLL